MKTPSNQPYINPKLRSSMTYHLGDDSSNLEAVDPISQTVPDMSMSIKEMVERHTRGLPIPSLGTPSYDPEYFPDLARFDLAEIELMREENAHNIKLLQMQHEDILAKQLELKQAAEAAANQQT